MKLHSLYLNPFRAFPEIITEDTNEQKEDTEKQISAIENNMSRAVMLALAQCERIESLIVFLQQLATDGKSNKLRKRIETLTNSLQGMDPNTVHVGLQAPPDDVRRALPPAAILLIGIRS
ncbi:MAG TPA: hypothetical protein VGZ47_22825 [Gemmataceae bacterium]|jgi:hypothetical protein|nr:hypothetical protein [Gemmataceae bacterium]